MPGCNRKPAVNRGQAGSASDPIKWQVAVDPPPSLPSISDGFSLAGIYPVAISSSDDVSFPFTQHPFALVKDSQRARVFDLTTGGSLGEVKPIAAETPFREAVSPDGLLWAQARNSKNVELIRIGSLTTGRELVSRGEGSDFSLGRISFLQFPTRRQLVAITRGNERAQAWIFGLDENGVFNSPTRKFDIMPQSFSNSMLMEDGAACSPGGKYLAAIVRSHLAADIVFYDLTTSTRAGALAMNAAEQGFTPTAVAFSGDGKQVAALGTVVHDHRLIVWDVATGAKSQTAALTHLMLRADNPQFTPQTNDYSLRWIPSGDGWAAYGRYIIRPGSSLFEPLVPNQFDSRRRLVLSPDVSIGWQNASRGYALSIASPELNAPNRQIASMPVKPPPKLATNIAPPMPQPMVNSSREIPKDVEVAAPAIAPDPPARPGSSVNQPKVPVTASDREASRLAFVAALENAAWQPMIDPPSKSLAYIPAPKFSHQFTSSTFYFPQQRNRFVTARTMGTWHVFDLASGKSRNLGELKINVYVTAVDDVGERFAFLPYQGSGHQEKIGVFNFKTEKTEALSVPQDKGRSVDFLTFDRAGNLIAVADNDYTYTVHSYPPDAKEPQWSVVVPHYLDEKGVHAISPGGRFLALAGEDVGSIVDLQNGKIVQQFRSPFRRQGHLPQALRFSPDGQYLAALGRGSYFNLVVWSMESGKIVTDRPYTFNLLTYIQNSDNSRTPLEWLGNEMLLVYGSRIADRQTGTLFYIIAQDRETSIKPLTDNTILAWRDGAGNDDYLANLSLPREKLATALAVARKASSEITPPLRKVVAGPLPALLEDQPAAGATLPLDAPNAAVLSAGPLDLKLEAGYHIPRFFVTDPGVQQAVVEVEHVWDFLNGSRTLAGSRAEPLGPERTARLDFYDLVTASKTQSLELPGRSRLYDVSPDGSLVLTGDLIDSSRLDIWAPKLTPHHALGFKPGSVYDARFVDKRHLLVLDNEKYVTLWRLPACEPVYRRESFFRIQLSPTRKYWTDYSGNVIDSMTGKALFKPTFPDNLGGHQTGSLYFSARGDSVWCTHSVVRGLERPEGAYFFRWNLAGELIDDQKIVHTSSFIAGMLEDRVLILDGTQANTGALLFNIERKKFIGHTAESPNNYFFASDGTMWGRRGSELGQFTVADLELDVNADREFKDILLLDRGMPIAIRAETQGITDQAAAEAALKELAEQQRFVIDPAASTTLRFFFHESTVRGVLKIFTPTITITDSTGQEHYRQMYGELKFDTTFDGAAWIKKQSLPQQLYSKPNPTIFKRPTTERGIAPGK